MIDDIIYLVGGRYWDVAAATYTNTPNPTKQIVTLVREGIPATEEYLVDTLKFYGYPLGQFASGGATESSETVKGDISYGV